MSAGAALLALAAGCGALAQPIDYARIRALNLEPNMGPGEGNAGARAPDEPRPAGAVLETRPPLNPVAKPAFREQTRAVAVKTKTAIAATVVAHGFQRAWKIVFRPDGRMFVTEKSGRIRIVTPDGKIGEPLGGVPEVLNYSDAGFFDLALDPDFARTRRIFFSYVEYRKDGNGLTVATATLSPDETMMQDVRIIFSAPAHNNVGHYGGRILVQPDRTLLVTVGDHFLPQLRIKAQDLDSTLGKIVRINFDGSIPADNPFAQVRAAEGAIWALGVRNIEGLVRDSRGAVWASDIGPQTGDEIDRIEPGHNYGWPVVGYGTEYSGKLINNGRSSWPGTDQPVYYWDPTIAPSGITFYSGKLIPEWSGNLFVGALAGQHLARLVMRNGHVVGEERLLQDRRQRIRDVVEGPDGALWVLTDSNDGQLLRLAPIGR
ncbi:PQQ-dependent sugar dehydrogenase [Sphingomonas quercus]|uniref:PQQ-dependent sugar dehydrogenase n=1 Tax=Sphingomonas quercus TaxID=2842451 RepID=A0ABS6BLZ5_9SPHN|nr:PQQ-dependent sugar dehydrogenase [Sphingomonas quercus]MBU3078791.1 PQQ-dependent sugar dehydrogenase [Sphingomonas quercus]